MRIPLLITALICSVGVFAQNSCSEAPLIGLGVYTISSVAGELPEPTCYGNNGGDNPEYGEWYHFVPEETLFYKISSDLPQNSGGDTRLQIYTGDCNNLTCLGGADDLQSGNYLSTWTGMMTANTHYILAWDDRWSEAGFDFEISEMETSQLSFSPVSVSGTGNKLGIVDMNGDNLDDIVGVSFSNTQIEITYQEEDGTLDYQQLETEEADNYPSWSMAAGDLDANGYNDLVFGGGSGVSFMFANEDGTEYTHQSGPEDVFSQRSNCIDIDNDGHLDAFVCHDVSPNVYYMNNGENEFEFNQGGLGDWINGGNYGSIWVDYDNDGDTDLFIAKCRGGGSPTKINELHRNNGDGTYTEVGVDLGLDDEIQTWSSAWADYDNDGDLDIFIGASSFSDGPHKFLRNDGDGIFVDVTAGSGLDLITSTGIENVCHDFDNDGFVDILGMGNTFMHNNGDMTFTEWMITPGNGPIGDMNNDGFLDILSGQLYMNIGNNNNYIKVVTQGVESNINGIGAMIRVYTPSGNYMRQVHSGDGFRYMSSLTAHFGLGQETVIDSMTVLWPSGIQDLHINPQPNNLLVVVEGQETIVVSAEERKLENYLIYPNPATDKIFVDFPTTYQSVTYTVFDISGKLAQQGSVNGKTINVSSLTPGAYILQLNVDGIKVEKKIIKE